MKSDMDSDKPKKPRRGRPPIISDDVWLEIEERFVAGEATLKQLAEEFKLSYDTVRDRSKLKRWPSSHRIKKALSRTDLPPEDAAKQIADKWAERKEQMRERLYQGSKRALDTFFALNPIPQDFAEAEKAARLLEKAITPEDTTKDSNINLAILTAGFNPTPIIDV
jgi:hypothetical protein